MIYRIVHPQTIVHPTDKTGAFEIDVLVESTGPSNYHQRTIKAWARLCKGELIDITFDQPEETP